MDKMDIDTANEIGRIIQTELERRNLNYAVIISFQNDDNSDCDIQVVPKKR